MARRQALPRLWLLTDERQGDALWPALDALPRGAGILFRHLETPPGERRQLFRRVRRLARRRGFVLLVEGPERGVRASAPISLGKAHNLKELRAVERAGIDAVFVSPVFATASHPGGATLGEHGFARLARAARVPVIALGGVDAARARRLRRLGAYGWAAIDGLTPPSQKRKAVPT